MQNQTHDHRAASEQASYCANWPPGHLEQVKDPLHAIRQMGPAPDFYKTIGTQWVTWSALRQPSALSQDIFHGTYFRLVRPGSQVNLIFVIPLCCLLKHK